MMFVAIALLCAGAIAWVMSPILWDDDRGASGAPRESPAPQAEPGSAADDAGEELVRKWRERRVACPTCGTRPESTAIYCSTCGRDLRET